MSHALSEDAIKQLFTEARTHHRWTSKPVDDKVLRALYDTMKWCPTSLNCAPMRLVWLASREAKERLCPSLMGNNSEQVRTAPVTAIVAYDLRFFDHLKKLFPAKDYGAVFANDKKVALDTAQRNSALQGAYLIMAARALGLDACPMSGFLPEKVDLTFFEGTHWRANFLCVFGYGDKTGLHPRGPRLTFDEACKVL